MEENNNKHSILIVDDSPTNLRVIQEILKNHYKVYATISGKKALAFLEKTIPDLILLDIEMPGMNGYEVLSVIKNHCSWHTIPVIFLTAQEGADSEEKAFKMGAIDYILKPFSPQVVLSRVQMHLELEGYRKNLEDLVKEKTKKLEKTQDAILDILTSVTAFRDNETGTHIMRTTLFVKLLVDNLIYLNHPKYQIEREYAENIIKCAKLHDIGKVGISDHILLKPDKLTSAEFEDMKEHTLLGAEMITNAMHDLGDESSFLNVAHEIVLYHHEHWNGQGYPTNLSGEEIPLSARILAVADVYDALISKRPYKSAYSHEEAMKIIHTEKGHFDPLLLKLSGTAFTYFPFICAICNDEKYPLYSSEIMHSLTKLLDEQKWVRKINRTI